jgi:hypothetical protein
VSQLQERGQRMQGFCWGWEALVVGRKQHANFRIDRCRRRKCDVCKGVKKLYPSRTDPSACARLMIDRVQRFHADYTEVTQASRQATIPFQVACATARAGFLQGAADPRLATRRAET